MADLILAQVVHVGLSRIDELHGPFVKLVEVVGSVVKGLPLKPQPSNVRLDGFDVLGFLFFRIGIVEAQVGVPAELGCQSEIQADGLGMADVQISIRFGRKTSLNPAVVFVGL